MMLFEIIVGGISNQTNPGVSYETEPLCDVTLATDNKEHGKNNVSS